MSYIAPPLSRIDLRRFATKIRNATGYKDKHYFPVVPFMEIALPQIFPDFNYQILEDDEMGST